MTTDTTDTTAAADRIEPADSTEQSLSAVPADGDAPKKEKDPLREKTALSIRKSTISFHGSHKRSVPQKLFAAFRRLYEAYETEIHALQHQTGFAFPVLLEYKLYQTKQHHGYFRSFADGSFLYYHRRNTKLNICRYHDYVKDIDLFRMSLCLKDKSIEHPRSLLTYTLPVNAELDHFYLDCQRRKALQAAAMEHRSYIEPVHHSFVSFDLERTGRTKDLPPSHDRIMEIGAVKVVDGQITDRFEQLINPGRKPISRVSRMTGIKYSMLKDQPRIEQGLQRFFAFIGDSVLLGHGIDDNDLPPIRQLARKYHLRFINRHYDTLRLAEILKESQGFARTSLEYLAQELQIPTDRAHRAADDAEAAAKVYLALQKLYYQEKTPKKDLS